MAEYLHFDCVSGISGNMILGALFDLGVSPGEVESALRKLPLEPWSLNVQEVRRGAIRALWCRVIVEEKATEHRHLKEIEKLVLDSGLPPEVVEKALDVFKLLAAAEGKVHGIPPEKVAFHEVGAVDSIVDILGSLYALHLHGCRGITCSRIPLGGGTAGTMHGVIPIPAPATCEILRDTPVVQVDTAFELTTPTGAALMKALAERFGPAPEMVLRGIGYGAGDDRPGEVPNVLRVYEGSAERGARPLAIMETNLDNVSAEAIGFLMDALLGAGALDVFFTPVVMKKSRPAQKLSVLCRPGDEVRLGELIFRHVPTLGIRSFPVSRRALERRHVAVSTPWGRVRVKEALMEGRTIHAWPEYEDIKSVAEKYGLGINRVREAVMAKYNEGRPPQE